MTDQEVSYDAIVRAEIAIEILNQTRAIVTARVYELEDTDPNAAEALRARRRELIDLQHTLSVDNVKAVEDIIALWGLRVGDEARL